MDQLKTIKQDLLKFKDAFAKEGKNFEVLRLVPTYYSDGAIDYRLTLKADWLTHIIKRESLWDAITTISHKLYALRDAKMISNETLMALHGTDIITQRNMSESEWQELQAIDILAEEEGESSTKPATENFRPISPSPVNKKTKAQQV